MPVRSIALAALCAVGGAVVATLLMGRDRDAAESKIVGLERRLGAVEQQPASPTTGVVPPQIANRPPPATPAVALPPANPTDMTSQDAQALPPVMDADAAAARRRYEAGLFERTLAAEQVDPAGSTSLTQGLSQAFSANPELAGNQLVGAECRVTLCRIDVLQRDVEDVESFLMSLNDFPEMQNTDTYWQRELNADGTSVMTMYVARAGHKLPDYRMPTPQ